MDQAKFVKPGLGLFMLQKREKKEKGREGGKGKKGGGGGINSGFFPFFTACVNEIQEEKKKRGGGGGEKEYVPIQTFIIWPCTIGNANIPTSLSRRGEKKGGKEKKKEEGKKGGALGLGFMGPVVLRRCGKSKERKKRVGKGEALYHLL